MASIDGIRLAHLFPGHEYEVGNLVGALLLAEGWAEPIVEAEHPPPGRVRPARTLTIARRPNLIREIFPPYFDHIGRGSRAADKSKSKSKRQIRARTKRRAKKR